METEYISREAALQFFNEWINDFDKQIDDSVAYPHLRSDYKVCKTQLLDCIHAIEEIPAAPVVEVPEGGIGELSDGYHTFNALYEQRLILTAALAKAHKDISWKSRLHENGEVPFGGGWFIVGFSTPEGEYTYHYELKDWDLFDCVELSLGKKWDGHTDKDVKRLLSIPAAPVREVKPGHWIWVADGNGKLYNNMFECSECHVTQIGHPRVGNFCPNCGADMREPVANIDVGRKEEGGQT